LQIGIVYPHHDIGTDPDDITRFVQSVEQIGFSHLRVYDHVLGADHTRRSPPLTGVYDQHVPFSEPLVLFGFLAGCTQSIELVAGILVLPQRQTALVAKQAADVAILSKGRLRLGVGAGWNHVEFAALNESFDDRGARLDEQVALLRQLWTEPLVDFTGSWHRVDRASILPRPPQPIPLWFGGASEAAQRRAARLGDGFIFAGDLAESLEMVPTLREKVLRIGRDPETFGIDVVLSIDDSVHDTRHLYERCLALGVNHLTIAQQRTKFRSPDERLASLAAFRDSLFS
jgi:probable F420-dependent oxidoreductase